jgi:hypothetical protein
MKKSNAMRVAVLSLGLASAGAVAGPNGSMAIVEGAPAPNSYTGEIPEALVEWCEGICIPLVTLEMVDPQKTRPLGVLHTWGKEFNFGSTNIQFKEFIIYELDGGQFYTVSQDGSQPTAAFIPQDLLPPKVGAVVLIGGTEGVVLPGTGKYRNAGGGYSTRLKLEADEFGNIVYYDELYFRFRELKLE